MVPRKPFFRITVSDSLFNIRLLASIIDRSGDVRPWHDVNEGFVIDNPSDQVSVLRGIPRVAAL